MLSYATIIKTRCKEVYQRIQIPYLLRLVRLAMFDAGVSFGDQDVFSSGQNAETAMLVASLKQTVSRQSQEIESLQNKLKEASSRDDEVRLSVVI